MGKIITQHLKDFKEFLSEKEYSKGTAGGYAVYVSHFQKWQDSKMLQSNPEIAKDMQEYLATQSVNTSRVKSIRAAWATGLRPSELCRLTINDVDFKEGLIYIRKAKFNKERILPIHNTTKGIRANAINIEMLTAEMIIEFMNYLERTRNNKNKTINNRLAAINAFMDYVVYERPEYSGIAVRIKGIPYRNIEKNNVCYMTKQEIESILKSCDNECFLGRRDTVIILLLYNTGMRVSELTTVRNQDLSLENQTCATLRIMGKGRKERVVPLWEKTRKWLLKYLSETSCNENNYIFKSPGVDHLTRSGVRYRINEVVKKAGLKCPSLTKKTITPHVFRHSTAMHLLQAGIDLSTIAIWLGHENMDTTHKYMVADLALKEMAMAKIKEPENNFRYQPKNKDILNFLNSL